MRELIINIQREKVIIYVHKFKGKMKNAPLLCMIINVLGKILNLLKKHGTPTGGRVQEASKGGGVGGIFRGAISSPKVIIVIIKKRGKSEKLAVEK